MAEITPQENVPNPPNIGFRILAIDNDSTVLENVKQMSNRCHYYQVITYSHALLALDHVRKNKRCIDLILIDVHMPNMDGYEFLKEIRKEIDVPVIVMSFDDSESSRMQSIKHGACDYWKKPFHADQFKNMWMHIARKAWSENKPEKKRGNNDSNATTGVVRDTNAAAERSKRVIWTDDLHTNFLNALRQLEEIGNAVPKRILELMENPPPDLTREKVASHLQKFRHQVQKNKCNEVKRQRKNGKPSPKTVKATGKPGGLECQAFDVTGRLPCKAPKVEVNQDVTSYRHPPHNIGNAQIRIPEPIIMNVDEESGYGVWSPSANTMRQLSIHENNVLTMDTLRLQQQQGHESLIMHNSPIFHGYTTPASAPAFHAANTFVPYASTSSNSLYNQPLSNFGYDDNQMYIPGTSRGHETKEYASDEDHNTLVNIYMSTKTGDDDGDEAGGSTLSC